MSLKSVVEGLYEAQDFLNSKFDAEYGSNWKSGAHPWLDYIWIECGELAGHYGRIFHYKKTPEDREQVIIELVDILHFGISQLLQSGVSADLVVSQINAAGRSEYHNDFFSYVRGVAKRALKEGVFDVYWFTRACLAYGLSFEELASKYFSKYALNKFRIDNGLLDGSYRKLWNGVEDNVYLERISSEVAPMGSAAYVDFIYQELESTYASL